MPLRIWYQDRAEYYFICEDCYRVHCGKQFSGSTKAPRGWRERAAEDLKEWEENVGGCQFCGPRGNGGPTDRPVNRIP